MGTDRRSRNATFLHPLNRLRRTSAFLPVRRIKHEQPSLADAEREWEYIETAGTRLPAQTSQQMSEQGRKQEVGILIRAHRGSEKILAFLLSKQYRETGQVGARVGHQTHKPLL